MNNKILIGGVFVFSLFSCTALKYQKTIDSEISGLGSIVQIENSLTHKEYQTKGSLPVVNPIRLSASKLSVSERNWTFRKDTSSLLQKDSTLVVLQIVDNLEVIKQLNQNSDILNYVEQIKETGLVTNVTMSFPKAITVGILEADQIFLIQNEANAFSLQILNDSVKENLIPLYSGRVHSHKISQFCWNATSGYKAKIVNLITEGKSCSRGLYKTAEKAKRKTEIKFK